MNIKKVIIVLSTFTVVYAGYYWGLPAFFNVKKNITIVEQKIYNKTGYKLKIEEPEIKMGILPAVIFKAKNGQLLNKDNSCAFGLENFNIHINLIPLLFGKLDIEKLYTNKIYFNLIYTKDGELRIGDYNIPEIKNNGFVLKKANIYIDNYRVSLDDKKQNKNLRIEGNSFINEFKNNKHIKLSSDAKLALNNKISDIKVDVDVKLPINKISDNQFKVNGYVNNLDLGEFSDYARAFPKSPVESLSGIINFSSTTKKISSGESQTLISLNLYKPHIIYKEKDRSMYCDDNLLLSADIDTVKNGIKISDLKVASNGINMYVNGDITKMNTSMPSLDLKVNIDKSRTEKFIPLFPGEENLLYDVNLLALKRNPFYGDIDGTLNINGKADTPNIYGKIVVKNGYLNAPLPHNTPLANIILDFAGTKMNMDIKVPAPINQMVFVTGNTDLYTRYADLDIKSTETVDLKTTQIVLNPLHEILKFQLGPVPIMDIRGIGNIDLKVKGTKEAPHAFGVFNFKNTTASFLDIHNMVLTQGEGQLDFEDENAHFYTKSAIMNGRPIKIDGNCNLYGDMKFDVETKGQNLSSLLGIIKSSPMLVDVQKMISPIQSGNGKTDLILQLYGKIPNIYDIVFNKNIFAKGLIKLEDANVNLQGINISAIFGDVKFENTNTEFDLTAKPGDSNISVKGKLCDKEADLKIVSPKFILKDGSNFISYKIPNELSKLYTNFDISYKGNIEKINPAGLNVKGNLHKYAGQNFSIGDVSFTLRNSTFSTSPIKGFYKHSPYYFNISVNNILSENQLVNGTFDVQNFDLSELKGLPVEDLSGIINLKGYIKSNGIYADTELNKISFRYMPAKIQISSGHVQFKKDILVLNRVNGYSEDMPISVDGKIINIFSKNPEFNLKVAARPTQNLVDNIYNKNALYPLKIKGDVRLNSYLSGNLSALRNKSNLYIGPNSSIYYMGAVIGNMPSSVDALSDSVNIFMDSVVYKNAIKINTFEYNNITDKNKIIPQLITSGNVALLKNNDLRFENLKIKTLQPTDTRIFNIIFRKPFIKQGKFTSNLLLNGNLSNPHAIGQFHITDIDMPILDASIYDIDMNFKKDNIYINSKGKILNNNLTASAVLKNRLVQPLLFEDININLETLDVNKITDMLMELDINKSINNSGQTLSVPNLGGIIIKKSEVAANKIKIKNLYANNFIANLNLNEKMLLTIPDFKFDVAGGTIEGNIQYNLLNHSTNCFAKIEHANVQTLIESLTELKGQVFGNVTGKMSVSCNGGSHDLCVQTLKGNGNFEIKNGRMPKLGSLEYLLKAGNLVKSGLTGLSIKGIVDVITPYKTGEFESITGNFEISGGIVNPIKIYSSGKALNIFVNGSYNINNEIANMNILGALTNNFNTIIGKIGSVSLNTLFNTIPWVNISDIPEVLTDDIKQIPNIENAARMFNAVIYGDINGNNYVRSFRWLK